MYTVSVRNINATSIWATSIIAVKLFVTMAQLAWGQISITMIKIGACRVKIWPVGENLGCGKNLFLKVSNLLLCEKNSHTGSPTSIWLPIVPTGTITGIHIAPAGIENIFPRVWDHTHEYTYCAPM